MDNEKLLEIYLETISAKTSTRGNYRQELIHGMVANDLSKKIDLNKYEIISKGYMKNQEFKINGSLFEKDTDITIIRKSDNVPVSAIPIKFIFSSYKKNWKNYFEQMVGETLNLKLSGIKVYNLIFLNENIPKFSSERKKIEGLENPTDSTSIEDSYKKYLSANNGELTDGLIYMTFNFNDRNVVEKYIELTKKSDLDWNSFSEDLKEAATKSEILKKYPILDISDKSLKYNDFLNKIIKDLENEKDDFEIIFEKEIDCPACGKKMKSESELKYHEDCCLNSKERMKLLN